jgi:polar amino acid transport system substrate-binding protein
MVSIKKTMVALTVLTTIWNPCNLLFAADKLILLTDDRPPFEFVTPSGEIDGVAVRVVKGALDKMNWSYEIKVKPWKRAQQEVKKGKADGFFAASKNNARDQYATLSGVIADQYWNWYLLKSSSLDPNSRDFKQKARTGSWFGSNSLKWLKKNEYIVKGNPQKIEALVKQLKAGRIDVIFGSNFAIEGDLKKMNALDKVNIVKGLHKPMGVYFSKSYLAKHPEFLGKFNEAIKDFQ